MTFGKDGTLGTRLSDPKDIGAILDVFQQHGHWEVDAARTYCGGTNEEYLAAVGWKERGLVVDTKLYPNKVSPRTCDRNGDFLHAICVGHAVGEAQCRDHLSHS